MPETYRLSAKQMRLLNNIKKKTLTCYSLGMLPKELCSRIYNMNTIIDKDYFDFLHKCTEDFLRIKGYYHKKENMERGNKQFIYCLNTWTNSREVNMN